MTLHSSLVSRKMYVMTRSGWVEINEATEDSDTGNYYER